MRAQARDPTASRRNRRDRRLRQEVDELFSFDVLTNDAEQDKSTADLDGQFIHAQLLIDSLQKMRSGPTEIKEFVQFCHDHNDCKDNKKHLELLEEFENEYSSDQSVWWYTRDSVVYRMLNKALRVQNVDILFHLRFFIRDLAEQLQANQLPCSGAVYRGQSLSKDELKKLKQSIGKLISINSFLSTTLYPEMAKIYAGGTSDLERVIFKINFNPKIDGIKPFADITLISQFPQEGEILFMLGSIFQIDSVSRNHEHIWIIQLTLCSDRDEVLKSIFQYLRKESNRCELDLLVFGNVLHDMGKYEQSKHFYNRCLKFLPPDDHTWRPYCYYLLGLVDTVNGENNSALDLFHQSLSIRRQTLQASDPSLADTLTAIARVHYINCNFDEALKLYKEALIIFQQAFSEDDLTSAMSYNNIGVVCKAQQKYSEALDYHSKAFAIRKRHLPSDHFRFGTSYNNMGEVYHGLGQYDTALTHYELADEVYKKSLPSRHVDVAILLSNKGFMYEKKAGMREALPFYKKAYRICRSIWSVENAHLVQIERLIEKTENTKAAEFSELLGTMWLRLFRPFKCIASLDPRTSYREAHQLSEKMEVHDTQERVPLP